MSDTFLLAEDAIQLLIYTVSICNLALQFIGCYLTDESLFFLIGKRIEIDFFLTYLGHVVCWIIEKVG